MTQCQMIMSYINEHGSITPQEAMNKLGIMRLAARINEIDSPGYPIIREMEKGTNRFGEPVRYARYRKMV